MRNETISEFINYSRSICTRQATAAPNRGAEKKEVPAPIGVGKSGHLVPQVPAVGAKMAPTSDLSGALPHEPHSLKRKNLKRKNTCDERLSFRVKRHIKDIIRERAEEAGSYPTAYALEILAAGLGLPTDEYAVARNRDLKEAYVKNSVALDRVGNLLNQLAAAAHKSQPCPLTKAEIDLMLAHHAAACKAHLGTVAVNDR